MAKLKKGCTRRLPNLREPPEKLDKMVNTEKTYALISNSSSREFQRQPSFKTRRKRYTKDHRNNIVRAKPSLNSDD
jgi:hypothetical protein